MSRRPQNKRKQLERLKKLREKRRPKPRSEEHEITELGDYWLFQHGARVFHAEFPNDWEYYVEEEGHVVFFPAEEDNVRFTVLRTVFDQFAPIILDNPKADELAKRLFDQLGATNVRPDNLIPHYCWKADRNQAEVAGHFWTVAAGDIVLGLSAYYPHGTEHIWEPVIERILSTFRIDRANEGNFNRACLQLIERLADRFPDEDYKLQPFKQIVGKNKVIPLANLRALIQVNPELWKQITEEFFENIAALNFKELGQETLDEVRDQIFPFIRRDSLGPGKDADENEKIIRTEWLGNLIVAYVIKIQTGFRYIAGYDMDRWKITVEELHEIAIANLRRDENNTKPNLPKTGLPFLLVHTGDNMESSRLLKPELYEQFAETLGGPFIAAIPAREALILFPNDRQLRRRVQDAVKGDFERSAYPITDRLFLVTPDGVTFADW